MHAHGVVAALGEAELVQGFRLAGVRVVPAENADAVVSAWKSMPPDVAIVILTPAAADALGGAVREPRAVPTAVIPS